MVGLVKSDMLPLGLPTISCPFPIPRACIPVSLQLYLGDSIPEEISIPTPPDFLPVTPYLTIKHCLLDKMTFVGGSFAGLCFVLIMINDSLMSTTMYDRNLWWYLAVCGAILGVTRSAALPPPYGDDAKACFKNVQKWTHFGDGPDELGSKDPRSAEVIGQFKQLYSPRFSTVLQEFVAILSTPIMLWTVYPKNAARILSFIREQVDTIGQIGRASCRERV